VAGSSLGGDGTAPTRDPGERPSAAEAPASAAPLAGTAPDDRLAHADRLATLGRLATAVVHDLQGPLTAIRVAAQALHSRYALDPSAGAARGEARQILDGTERILELVRQLLAFSRPSAERFERLDAARLVGSATSLCAHLARDRGATLVGSAPFGLAVRGLRLQLEQVLVNLVANACEAVRPGGRIEVTAAADDGQVRFEVRDDGVGISPADLPRIFEPFFTTRPPGEGTGLGLPIVRGIVERHGGTVAVASAPGRTCFTVRLPAAPAAAE
jgi:two-component system NtrC family sensor kinase